MCFKKRLLKSWDQSVFIVANDVDTREKMNLWQVLSHTWVESGLLLLHVWCIRWEWKKMYTEEVMGVLEIYIKAMSIQCQEKLYLVKNALYRHSRS